MTRHRRTYLPPALRISLTLVTLPLTSSHPEEKPVRFEITFDDAWVDNEEIEL